MKEHEFRNNPKHLFKDLTVDIYDSTFVVARSVQSCGARTTSLFVRGKDNGSALNRKGVLIHGFPGASGAGISTADVCMLDGNAIKVMALRYPDDSQYVLARLAPRASWFLGFGGLIRRIILRRVKLKGIVRLSGSQGVHSYWLVVARKHKPVNPERFFLPKGVGIPAFLDWLRKENIIYVVLRFYEKLPELRRKDGDLDLLVADKDAKKVGEYLREQVGNSLKTTDGNVPIGVHTVSRSKGLPYYPLPLARRILSNAVDGPAGSRIPAPKDALLSFIYHALYHHKGYATNIPNALESKPVCSPGYDYGAEIQRMASDLGIEAGKTMEELDEYLAGEGWRPKLDTLAKIAEKNAWARDRFFSNNRQEPSGLAVFVLKERVLERNLVDEIVNHLRKKGLVIAEVVTLSKDAKERATEHVRGGNWTDASGKVNGLLPAAIVIAIDPLCAHLPPTYAASRYERKRAKKRKAELRQEFDLVGEESLVHSADTTQEAWEYIETCFPHDVDALRDKIEKMARAPFAIGLSRFLSPRYTAHALRSTIHDFITKRSL